MRCQSKNALHSRPTLLSADPCTHIFPPSSAAQLLSQVLLRQTWQHLSGQKFDLKLRLFCFSSQYHTQENCLRRGSGWKYVIKQEFILQTWGMWTMNMALRLVLGVFLRGRRHILLETYNWTVWIDRSRTYRICFKRHHYASIHCNNKRNTLEIYFNPQRIFTSSFSTVCFSQKPPTLPARNNSSINVISLNIHCDATYNWD